MLRRRAVTRWMFAIAAAVQVLLPAAASLADGWLDRADAKAGAQVSHIESHGTKACARIHPDNCVLCRVVGGLASPSRGVALPERIARLVAPAAEQSLGAGFRTDHGLPASRAPPRANEFVEHAA